MAYYAHPVVVRPGRHPRRPALDLDLRRTHSGRPVVEPQEGGCHSRSWHPSAPTKMGRPPPNTTPADVMGRPAKGSPRCRMWRGRRGAPQDHHQPFEESSPAGDWGYVRRSELPSGGGRSDAAREWPASMPSARRTVYRCTFCTGVTQTPGRRRSGYTEICIQSGSGLPRGPSAESRAGGWPAPW